MNIDELKPFGELSPCSLTVELASTSLQGSICNDPRMVSAPLGSYLPYSGMSLGEVAER